MEKDARILLFLEHLKYALGEDAFVLNDHWDCDSFAIGISKASDPSVLAYIQVLASSDEFALILEVLAEPGTEIPYLEVGHFETVSRNAAALIIGMHFGLPPTI